jgi:pSer/pThr/pTyr-binding forkhead associated (FHA) protein
MSLLTRILVKTGLADTESQHSDDSASGQLSGSIRSLFLEPQRSGDEALSGAAGVAYEGARMSETRYAAIRKAVEERLVAFLRRDVVSHLEIGHDDEFILHFIEIRPEIDADPLLDRFLKEFTQAARIEWVKKFVRSAAEEHVRVDQFLGVDRTCPRESLGPTELYDEQLNRSGALPAYGITLYGRWEKRMAAPSLSSASRRRGPSMHLSVQDGKISSGSPTEVRELTLASFPAVLGSSPDADTLIAGHYVSARQCTLDWDGERVWLEDHSRNGTWVDGRRLNRGSRVDVNDGMVISFGRQAGDADYARFPLMRVRFDSLSRERGMTPVVGSGSTPVVRKETRLLLERPAFAMIYVGAGQSQIRILTVPFTIGRASDQDYVVPGVNEGVSREHLVIKDITETGALTVNKAVKRNGTYAHDLSLPEEFEWRFDQEIVLARKSKNAPAVHLILKRPA